jgi:hypothetical protein
VSAAMETAWPGGRDREYGMKLERLRACGTDQPLVLVLGSSRVGTGLRPRASERPDSPVVFNMGVRAAGPLMQRLWLERLLDDGVRPDAVVLEYWPPACLRETTRLAASRLGWRDGLRLSRYLPWEAFGEPWLLSRLLPVYAHRAQILNRLAPDLAPDPEHWERLDALGWRPAPTPRDTAHAAALIEATQRQYRPGLAKFRVPPIADQALRDALTLCRRRGLRTSLIFMPEAKALRELYPPRVDAAVRTYLGRLSRETGADVLDCRDWLDEDDFSDGYHLRPAAADRFSERFAREVVRGFGPLQLAAPRSAPLQ